MLTALLKFLADLDALYNLGVRALRKSFVRAGFVLLLAVGILGPIFSNADVIFSNAIEGTNPNTANPYTTSQVVNGNITASGIGRGAGASGTNANNRYNANSWNTAAIDLTAYFTFTLTPNSNFAIDFT